MNLFRKSAWAVVMLMLVAVAGCTGDDQAASPPGPSTSNPPQAPTKPIVPPASTQASKDPASKDMQNSAPKPGEAKKAEESPKLEPPKAEGKGDTAAAKLTDKEIAAIKELPAAEQDQAIKQAVCPVSNAHLGEMGKPIKITAEGRTFFLCCDSCEPDVKKDPKAVIAKLDARAGK